MHQKRTGLFTMARVVCASAAIGLLFAFLALSHSPTAEAAAGINEQLNFQGRLLNAAGAVVADGNYNMEFKIYCGGDGVPGSTTTDCTSGTLEKLLWTETRLNNNSQGVVVKNGYFSVNLGSVTAFGSSVDWNEDKLWLSVNVGNTNATCTPFSNCAPDGEMNPMKRLSSSPYALNSKTLQGLTASNFVQLAQGVQTDTSTTASSIFINKNNASGTPNILQLQKAGSDVLVLDNTGQLELAIQGSSGGLLIGGDANLYRGVANALRTDDQLQLSNSSTTCTAYATGGAESCIWFGSDTNLYRSAANTLKTDDALLVQPGANTTTAFQVQNTIGSNALVVDTTAINSLISNQSFETDTTGWAYSGAAGGSIARNTTEKYIGSASLAVATGTPTPGAADGAKYTTSSLAISSTYIISWYAKRDATAFTDIIAAYDRDGAGAGAEANCTSINTQTVLSTGWTRFSCTITTDVTAPAADAYIIIKQSSAVTRTFYIDAVQIELTTGTAFKETGLSFNGRIASPVSFMNQSDSTTAFQIQNAAGTSNLFVADSLNTRVGVGATPANSLLTIGTNTTTTAGGLIFGTDTNLYRSAANELTTDDSLRVDGDIDLGGSDLRAYSALGGTLVGTIGYGQNAATTGVLQLANIAGRPIEVLSIDAGTMPINVRGASAQTANLLQLQDNAGTILTAFDSAGKLIFGPSGSQDTNLYRTAADTLKTDDSLLVAGANFGVNTTGPDRRADILDASNPQLRLTQADGTTYADFQVDSNGDLIQGVDGTTNQLVLDNGGGVGISTVAPLAKLSVSQANQATLAAIQQTTANNAIQIESTYGAGNNYLPGLVWNTSDNNSVNPKAGIWVQATGSGSKLFLGTSNAYTTGITNTALMIDQNGQVGINTTGPDRKLDVLDASNPQLRLTQADGSVYADFQVDSNGDLIQNVDGVSNQLVLDNGGSIGVGTAAPNAKVDILGTTQQLRLSYDTTNYSAFTVASNGSLTLNSVGAGGAGDVTIIPNSTLNLGTSATDVINIGRSDADLLSTVRGSVKIQDVTNDAAAVQIQNATGSNALVVDTTAINSLISNQSFETDTTGWAYSGAAGGSIARNTTEKYIGSASLAVATGTPTPGAADGAKYTTSSLAISSTYIISWYAKRDATAFTDIIAAYDRDGAGAGAEANCTSINTQTVLSTGWTRFSCTIATDATTPAADAYIIIKQSSAVTRTFYIDAVQIELTTGTAFKETGLSFNGRIASPVSFMNQSDSTTAFQIQNAAGTSNLFVADTINGRIGIGTAAPGQKLEVNGDLKLSAANPTIYSGSSYITIPNGLYVSGNTFYAANEAKFRGGIANDTAVNLAINGGTSGITNFTGSVGINTTGPDRRLDVLDNVNPQLRLTYTDGSVYTDLQTPSAGGLSITTNNLTASGAYGLQGSFTVAGTAASQTYYGQKLAVTNSQTTNANTLYGQYISFTDAGSLANTVTGLYVDATTANTADTTYAAILQGGNVGIGDTAPSVRLSLGGSGTANGIVLGDDAASPVNLYRNGNDQLKTDDQLFVGIAKTPTFQSTTIGQLLLSDETSNGKVALDFTDLISTNLPKARVGAEITGSGSYLKFGTSNNYSSGITNTALQIDYNGAALFKNGSNSTTAFQVQNAAGANAIVVDTTPQSTTVTNPSIEYAIAGNWLLKGSATVSQDSTQQFIGSSSLKVVTTAVAGDGTKQNITLTNSQQYTVSFYAKLDSASAAFATMVVGYAYDGANETSFVSPAKTVVSTMWERYTYTFTPTGITGTPYLFIKQTDGVAHTFYIDAVQIDTGASPSAFKETGLKLGATLQSPLVFSSGSSLYQGTSGLETNNSFVLRRDQQAGVAPELIYRGYNGSWLSGIDSANSPAGRDFAVASKVDYPNPGNVYDLIYLHHNGASSPPTVDIGATSPAVFTDYRLRVMSESGTPAMGSLTLDAASGQTGKFFAVRNASGSERVWINSPGATANDFGIHARTTNSASDPAIFQLQNTSDEALLAIDQTGTIAGGFNSKGLNTPGAPTVTVQGTTGATTWGYKITARSNRGETLASTETQVTNGNATLTGGNFNRITWSAVTGAKDYRVWRTTAGGTPSTTGVIGTVSAGTTLQLDDTGLVASGSTPTADNSGFVGLDVTSPGAKLDVKDTTSVTSFTGSNLGILRLQGGTANNDLATLTFDQVGVPMGKIGTLKTGSGSFLVFGTSNNYSTGITNNALQIDYNGRVGINQTLGTALSYALDVAGDINIGAGNGYRIGGVIGVEAGTSYLRINQSNQFTNGIWLGSSALRAGAGDVYLGSTGGDGQIALLASAADTTRRVTIDGSTGDITATNSVITPTITTSSGNLTLAPAGASSVVVKPATNSTTAFQVQNTIGSSALVVDTTAINSLITNQSFETDTAGWAYSGAAGGSITRNTTEKYIGGASLAVATGTPTPGAADGAKYTTSSLAISSSYIISWYAKRDATAFTDIIAAYDRDGAGAGAEANCTGINTQTVLSTGWTRFSCTITTDATAPAADAYIVIKQSSAVTRTFYIDAVQIELTTGTAFKETGLSFNGRIASPVSFMNQSDSTHAFQIQNAAGTSNLFVADTINNRIGIGTATPGQKLEVNGTALATSFASNVYYNAALGTALLQRNSGTATEIASGSGEDIRLLSATGLTKLNRASTANELRVYENAVSPTNYTSLIHGTLSTSSGALSLVSAAASNINVSPGTTGDVVLTHGDASQFAINATPTADTAQDSVKITLNPTITGSTAALQGVVISQSDNANTGVYDSLLKLENLKTPETTTNGLFIEQNAASGTLSNGIQITNTAGTLSTGINFTGTFGNYIVAPNFSVSNAGAVVAVGVNSGSGLIQGTGGLTITGATNINTSGSNATNIGTGTNAGTITVGNTSTGDLALNDAQWTISGAGLFTTASNIAVNGGQITSTGTLTLDATSTVIIPAADTFQTDDVTSTGALSLVSAATNNVNIQPGTTGDVVLTHGDASQLAINATPTADTAQDSVKITLNPTITGSTATLQGVVISQSDNANTGVYDSLLKLENLKTPEITANGLFIEQNATSGTLTNGINITNTAGTLTKALLLSGTFTNLIDAPNFDVLNSGNITTAGTLAVNGDSITADGATLIINAAGTVNIQDALDVDSTIQAGSSNVNLTLATGFIDADALTLIAAADLGTGTSSGSGLIARSDGIGLLQGCTDTQILKWVEATDTWDCGSASSTLQQAYDAGNTITTTSARDISITLADTATDSNFNVDIATGSTSKFQVRNGGSVDIFSVDSSAALIGMQTNDAGHSLNGTCSCILNSAAGTFGSQTARDAVASSAVYRGKLFVATKETDAAGVYRYDGGTTWTLVTYTTLGEAASDGTDAINIDAFVMTVWNDTLYIGSQTGASTGALYKSTSADTTANTFTLVNATRGTFGSIASVDGVSDLVVYNGNLYVGTQETNLAEVDRYDGGTTFTEVSNITEGRIGGNASTTVDGVVFAVWGGRLFAGNITGGGAARLSVYTGVGTTWTDLNAGTAGAIGAETTIDDITGIAVWGGALYIATGDLNLANIYRWEPPLGSSDTTVANFKKVNNASGKVISGDTANIDSMILRSYRGRLYAGTTNQTDGTGALYEFDGVPGSWTLINATRGTFGAQTGVGAITVMQEMNGTLYLGTDDGIAGIGSVYSWTKAVDQSYALRFEGPTGNYGTLRFIGAEQAIDNQGRQGTFNFSHGVSLSSGAFDYAEDYPTLDYQLEAGAPVSVDPRYSDHVRRAQPGDTLLGVVSENPGFRISSDAQPESGAKWVPIALVGRVPVKVVGQISAGDKLTLSDTPGILKKATAPGEVVGSALENYAGEVIGKISMYVNPGWHGQINAVALDASSLRSLAIKNSDGTEVAGLDNLGNAFFAGTLTADVIKANRIEGLEVLAGRIAGLESSTIKPPIATGSDPVASSTPDLSQLKFDNPVTALSLTVLEGLEVKGGLIVAGPAKFGGEVSFSSLVRFFSTASFAGPVTFDSHVLFGKDTAGKAVIKVGKTKVDIKFEEPYKTTPFINASYIFEETKAPDGSVDTIESKQARLISGGYSYGIGNITEEGFVIFLNKPASEDITLSWVATAIKDSKVSLSEE